jgi:hypothetical protein
VSLSDLDYKSGNLVNFINQRRSCEFNEAAQG